MSNAQNAGNGNKSRSSLGQRSRWTTTKLAETSCGATIVPIIWKGRDKHRGTRSCTNAWLAPRRKAEQRSKKVTLIRIDAINNICLYAVNAMLARRRYLTSCGHHRSGSVTRNVNADLVMSTLAKHIHIGMGTPGMRTTALRGKTWSSYTSERRISSITDAGSSAGKFVCMTFVETLSNCRGVARKRRSDLFPMTARSTVATAALV